MKKSLQFELWHECNSLCKYCYLGSENRITPTEVKISNLQDILKKIRDPKTYEEHDNLSFIGGEFFQGQLSDPEVRTLFFEIMKETSEKLRQKVINSVWLCATLTIGNQKDLYDTLDLFKDIKTNKNDSSGLWLITSYDTIGRFHTAKMEENWNHHMLNIQKLYPNIKFNTTMILTQDLIEKYINNQFSFKDYMQKYNSQLFFKQPSPGSFSNLTSDLIQAKQMMEAHLPGFFPHRETFLKFLTKFLMETPELYEKLFNIKFRADDFYRNFNDGKRHMELNIRYKNSAMETNIESDMVTNTCGHLMQYAGYLEDNKCMFCDKQNVKNQMF